MAPTAIYHGEDEQPAKDTEIAEHRVRNKVNIYCPGRKCFNEKINIPLGQPMATGFSNVDSTGDLDKYIFGGVMK